MWTNKKIVLMVTGGIAAYKSLGLARLFIQAGAQVQVAMTPGATAFVSPMTFQVLTKHKVHVDTFDESQPDQVQHIHLADWADLVLVAPATANTLAKMAHGIADNFVTSSLLAMDVPQYLVPAMNEKMWLHPATQANLATLATYGAHIMEPVTGFLAEGYSGKGRMPEVQDIFDWVTSSYFDQGQSALLRGKKILITAGGTKERIDPVRYITNDSSGKMGYALAKAAQEMGGQVYLVSTRPVLAVPKGVQVTYVETALEMSEAVQAVFPQMDIAMMVAAVSDFRVEHPADEKIKKVSDQTKLHLTLVQNPDILSQLGHSKKAHQMVIGFAAETQNLIGFAKAKLEKKQADLIIANDVSQAGVGFHSDYNAVTLLFKDGRQIALAPQSKDLLAGQIWKEIIGS